MPLGIQSEDNEPLMEKDRSYTPGKDRSYTPGTPEWFARNKADLVQKLVASGFVNDESELDGLVRNLR